jgi:hypothetical protein
MRGSGEAVAGLPAALPPAPPLDSAAKLQPLWQIGEADRGRILLAFQIYQTRAAQFADAVDT